MTKRQEAILEMFGKEPSESIDFRDGSWVVGWEFEFCKDLEELKKQFTIEQIEQLYEEQLSGEVILSDEDNDSIDKLYELEKSGTGENFEFDAAQYKASLSVGKQIKDSIPLYQNR